MQPRVWPPLHSRTWSRQTSQNDHSFLSLDSSCHTTPSSTILMKLLSNQIRGRLTALSKANLLTPGCHEAECTIYCRGQASSPGS